MSIPIFDKQPGETLDYDVDLSEFLPSTDAPASVTKAVSPSGLSLGTTSINASTKVVKQWISGGAAGTTYKVTLTITSTEGRIKEVEFKIRVKEL